MSLTSHPLPPASPLASQEKSYFALHLPHGWWVFGLDLALVDDIDIVQYRWGGTGMGWYRQDS